MVQKEAAEHLWRFIPAKDRVVYEKMAEISGLSRSGALALKLCHEALMDYCPDAERITVVATLAHLVTREAQP